MGILTMEIEKSKNDIINEVDKIQEKIEKKENQKQKKSVLIRQLKNDVMHQMAEDLKNDINIFRPEYISKFDDIIYKYFKTENEIQEARLTIDENFITLKNKAIKYNEEERLANSPQYIMTWEDISEFCKIMDEHNDKVLKERAEERREREREKQRQKNKNGFWLLLNMILGGF